MAAPWLDQPVMLHSSRADTCKLTPEQCAFRRSHWLYWYQTDRTYAIPTVSFFIVGVALFAIAYVFSMLRPLYLRRTRPWQRIIAVFRFFAYRGFRIQRIGWTSPPLGVLLLGLVMAVFFFAMTLGPKPYYWPKEPHYGSSPPLATRTGFLALGCMPFVFLSASKANMITALTGVPHEKTQVFHHWISWAMFVLALIHTFPFIVYNIEKGEMTKEWNSEVFYWTGVIAILAQAYLTIMSIRPIRNRYYEFFKSTHFVAVLIFVVFFFLHCDFRLSSWDYFIATGALYMACLLYSQFRTYFEYGFGHRATLSLVGGGFVRVSIPAEFSWTPGQHMFIRFLTLGLHSLTAHPFTICSLPASSYEHGRVSSELVFYIQPHGGITARLAKMADKQPNGSLPVLLEGPYGGMNAKTLMKFDKALVIAGGSGAGFTLPLIEDVVRRLAQQHDKVSGEKREILQLQETVLHVVLATRDRNTQKWFHEAVEHLMSRYSSCLVSKPVHLSVYFTGSSSESSDVDLNLPADIEKRTAVINGGRDEHSGHSRSSSPITTVKSDFESRPNLPNIIQEATSANGTSVGIAICGPASMLQDVRNAAAAAQAHFLRTGAGAKDVYLHTEQFSW